MDLTVTVGAASVKEDRSRPRRHGVTRCVMARSAKPRVCDFEKPIIDGSVRLMAIATVFKRRRMFPQKQPAPLGVAGVTVFIDAGLLELRRIGGAVRIMAVRTGYLCLLSSAYAMSASVGLFFADDIGRKPRFRPAYKKGVFSPAFTS